MGIAIRIVNKSATPIDAFVSKYNGGNDDWFPIGSDDSDTWTRDGGWELVAFRKPGTDSSAQRAGKYINIKRTPVVEFYSFSDIRLIEV
jgi:hypothetical protein